MENPAVRMGCGVFLYPSSLFTQQKKTAPHLILREIRSSPAITSNSRNVD